MQQRVELHSKLDMIIKSSWELQAKCAATILVIILLDENNMENVEWKWDPDEQRHLRQGPVVLGSDCVRQFETGTKFWWGGLNSLKLLKIYNYTYVKWMRFTLVTLLTNCIQFKPAFGNNRKVR